MCLVIQNYTHNMPKREKGVRPHKKKYAETIIVSSFFFFLLVGCLVATSNNETKTKKKATRFLMHFCLFLNKYLWTGKIGYSIRVGGHF